MNLLGSLLKKVDHHGEEARHRAEYFRKMKRTNAYSEAMADRNIAWHEKTGREAEERPGFAQEWAELEALLADQDVSHQRAKASSLAFRAEMTQRTARLR